MFDELEEMALQKNDKAKLEALYTAICGNREGAKGFVEEFKEMKQAFVEHQKEDRRLFDNISQEFVKNNKQREESKQDVIKEIKSVVQPVIDYQTAQKTIFGFAKNQVIILVSVVGFIITALIAIFK